MIGRFLLFSSLRLTLRLSVVRMLKPKKSYQTYRGARDQYSHQYIEDTAAKLHDTNKTQSLLPIVLYHMHCTQSIQFIINIHRIVTED